MPAPVSLLPVSPAAGSILTTSCTCMTCMQHLQQPLHHWYLCHCTISTCIISTCITGTCITCIIHTCITGTCITPCTQHPHHWHLHHLLCAAPTPLAHKNHEHPQPLWSSDICDPNTSKLLIPCTPSLHSHLRTHTHLTHTCTPHHFQHPQPWRPAQSRMPNQTVPPPHPKIASPAQPG